MLRMTQATDTPFRAAERVRVINEVGRNRGLSEAQLRVAEKKPELYRISDEKAASGASGFTDSDLKTIEFESARAVFQQENIGTEAAKWINSFIRQRIGNVGYVPYRMLALFQKTPINVAAEVLSFTPAGLLRNWKDLPARERSIAINKVILGSLVMGAMNTLYTKGIVTANLDTPGETNKARELARSGGVMPPGAINISALRRYIAGKDTAFQASDIVKALSALGLIGALGMMTSTARRIQERTRSDDVNFTTPAMGIGLGALNFIMQQQFLKGTTDFIKLLAEEGGGSMEKVFRGMLTTAASPFAPATLGAIRRAEREFVPVIGGEGPIKGFINEINQRWSVLGLKVPGSKDANALPVRRDLWGEKVKQTPAGSNPWVDQFFDAWRRREIEADPLNQTIYTLWRRTADNAAIPSIPSPMLTVGGRKMQRLTPEQFERYTELVGTYRRSLAERVGMSGAFNTGDDERKIRMLEMAYRRGLDMGKIQFMRERGREFDLIYITRYTVASQALPLIARHAPQARLLFCNADLHHLRELQIGRAHV